MVNFTDNVVMSINDTQTLSTDVVYFDNFELSYSFKNLNLVQLIWLILLITWSCQ